MSKCPKCKNNTTKLIHVAELEYRGVDLEERPVNAFRCPLCYCFITDDRYTAHQFLNRANRAKKEGKA